MAPSRRKGTNKAAAVAAARRKWKVGDLVLAKVKGFPAWPATVSEPEKWGYPADQKKVIVHFFGCEQIAFCNPVDIEEFTEEKKASLLGKRHGKGADFVRAVNEIINCFEKLKKQDQVSRTNGTGETHIIDENNSQESLSAFMKDDEPVVTVNPVSVGTTNDLDSLTEAALAAAAEDDLQNEDMQQMAQTPSNLVFIETPMTGFTRNKRNVARSRNSGSPKRKPARRLRSSLRVDASRLRSITLPSVNNDRAYRRLCASASEDRSLRRSTRIVKSSDDPEGKNADSLAFVANDCVEESDSGMMSVGSDTLSIGICSTVDSVTDQVGAEEPFAENNEGETALSDRLDFQSNNVVKKKRKPNRKRHTNDVFEAAKLSTIASDAEEFKTECVTPRCSEKPAQKHAKDDGDEHLPLVKRARVRMGRPSPAAEEDLTSVHKEEKISEAPDSHSGQSVEPLSCKMDAPPATMESLSIKEEPAPSSVSHVSPANRPSYWETRKNSVDGEAALPPSKRLHRALEAMSANVAEDCHRASNCSPTANIQSNGCCASSLEYPEMSEGKNTVIKLGSEAREDLSNGDFLLGASELCTMSNIGSSENGAETVAVVSDCGKASSIDSKDPELCRGSSELAEGVDTKSLNVSPFVEVPAEIDAIAEDHLKHDSVNLDEQLANLNFNTPGPAIAPANHVKAGCTELKEAANGSDPDILQTHSGSTSLEDISGGSANIDTCNRLKIVQVERDEAVRLSVENNQDSKMSEFVDEARPASLNSKIMRPVTPKVLNNGNHRPFFHSTSVSYDRVEDRTVSATQSSSSLTDGPDSVARASPPGSSVGNISALDKNRFLGNISSCFPDVQLHLEKAKLAGKSSSKGEGLSSFEAVIKSLTRTKESIGRATRIAIDCAKFGFAAKVVEILARSLENESSLHKKVDLFFLVDSITQCSRGMKGDGGVYPSAIQALLPRLLLAAAPPGSSTHENHRQCLKVLRVWQEKKILPEPIIRHHIRELDALCGSYPTIGSNRTLRNERAFDDPIREMEGMLVDEYGSNSSIQLPGFCMPPMLRDDDAGSDSDGESFEAVTPEHNVDNLEGEKTLVPSIEKRRHILEDVDGELEMEDVAPCCEDEITSTGAGDQTFMSHQQSDNNYRQQPNDVPLLPPHPLPPPVFPPAMLNPVSNDSLIWATQLSSFLTAAGVSLPSVEVAELLVSHICWSNNTPAAWKFLEKALTLRIVPPLFVLALLFTRVVSSRRRYPVAYRLYMELLKRYAFSLSSLINGPSYQKIMESIDDVLQFREIFGVQSSEPGHLVVQFIFSSVWGLLDASLEDEGLLEHTLEKKSKWPILSQDMEIDCLDVFEVKKMERRTALSKMNSLMAIDIIGDFFQNKVTSRILYLARRNMPMHWDCFIQNLRLLTANSISLRNSKNISPETLMQLTSDRRKVLSRACKMSIIATTSMPFAGKCNGSVRSALWLPIDLYLEDTLNGSQVTATSAAETLTGLVKALQALNQTTWQDAFLGLWTAALRLVQRGSNSIEGPIPRLDTGLCILLSVSTLAVVNIVEEEEIMLSGEAERSCISQKELNESWGKRREALVSSLQWLDDFEELLTPPPLVSSLANQAAAKAMMFLSGVSIGNGHLDGMSLDDIPVNCSGNLRHLIVEACIARNVLDTSAYLWPGYVKGRCNQIPQNISGLMPGWSSLMKGLPLTPTMISALVSTPATSLAEIERIYEIAVSGTDDEKISAATIFCGASLYRGWNIQEHTGLLIIKLLSPAVPADISENESHLIGYAPFLNTLLVGLSSFDCIQIFSLHGLVPQLAAALMPICEVFGSCAPNMSWTLNTGEEISSHAVFSNAFTLLLKLWRFDQPPLDHVMGDGAPVGSHLTPDYLLLVHNSQLASYGNIRNNQNRIHRLSRLSRSSSEGPVFMDSFPKLKRWYRKHQECISSILSSLVPGNTVHEIVEALLSMMFRKINGGGQQLAPKTSGSSSSSASGPDESYISLKIPAWDILEAVPFVLDAALTACAHRRLSPRDLTTGLKDLADFLPASLATIVSYFSAEVSRGLWKHAFMNGTDWPSPAANLSMVEEQIKKILAATGVNVPCLAIGASTPVTLPLPLAALVSLTITYRLDRGGESSMKLVGPALKNLGVGCPWPSMSIITSLWVQKAKHWSDFLIFAAAQTVFHHNNDAIVQLLRVCFTTALGLNSSITSNGGVGALLGHGFGSQFPGGISAVAPGTLYLTVHRSVRNVILMTEEIVSLLMHTVKDIAHTGLPEENLEKLKKTKYGMKYGHVSLAAAMSQVRTAASLGATLIWITGGLNSIQSLFKEILPSWFVCTHKSEPNGQETGGMVLMLGGYALAYFTLFSGLFAWGVDSALPASKRRPKVLGMYFEFLARALDGNISLGCNQATWRSYVTGYLSLIISCTPNWMLEIDVEVLKRISKRLIQWNEEEMAVALLGISGISAMGAAAEMIIETGT